jgi:hypothetical protein
MESYSTVQVPHDLNTQLKVLAAVTGVTVKSLVRDALQAKLDQHSELLERLLTSPQ